MLPGGSRAAGAAQRGVRARVARTGWRRRLAARRPVDLAYRLGVAVVGSAVVVVGLVTVPLPGPGWLTVLAGLFVLATEFRWAERLLGTTRRQVGRWSSWVAGRSLPLRLALGLGTVAATLGVVVVVLHLVGVPAWVPGWVPLWR